MFKKEYSSGFFQNQSGASDSISEKHENKVDYFSELLAQTENLEVKEMILDGRESGNIQAVLLGLKPACHTESSQSAMQIKQALRLIDADFGVHEGVLYNKHLVVEIAKQNPDYFKGAGLNAQEIVIKYMADSSREESKNTVVAEGLLLGFPKVAAQDFARFELGDTVKRIFELEEFVPKESADWSALQEIEKEEREYINKNFGNNGEYPMRPPHVYEPVRRLFFQYLPEAVAQKSWEYYQGTFVKIGKVYWMQWCSDSDSETIKRKYRDALESSEHCERIQGHISKLCYDLLNDSVKKTATPEDVERILELAMEIKRKYATRERNLTLGFLLDVTYNTRNGREIKTVDELMNYLEELKKEYEKENQEKEK